MAYLYRIFFALAILLTLGSPASSQTILMGEDEIPVAAFQLDIASKPAEYAGDYHFGFSEGESNLHLVVKGTSVTGELSYGVFNDKGGWDERKVKLKGGKIVGNMLIADGWSGVFVRYKENRGVIFFKAPTDMIGLGTEFGFKTQFE